MVKTTDDRSFEMSPETNRRHQVMEMHPVNRREGDERPPCGAQVSDDERVDVEDYLEGRKDGIDVGTVCEKCKAHAVSFAVIEARDLEDEGLLDEAEEYRQLAETLVRETGWKPTDW